MCGNKRKRDDGDEDEYVDEKIKVHIRDTTLYGREIMFLISQLKQDINNFKKCFDIVLNTILEIHKYEHKFYTDIKEKQIKMLNILVRKHDLFVDRYEYHCNLLDDTIGSLPIEEQINEIELFNRLSQYEL